MCPIAFLFKEEKEDSKVQLALYHPRHLLVAKNKPTKSFSREASSVHQGEGDMQVPRSVLTAHTGNQGGQSHSFPYS